jgi:hypothetical protein
VRRANEGKILEWRAGESRGLLLYTGVVCAVDDWESHDGLCT